MRPLIPWQEHRGVVFMLPGIEGGTWQLTEAEAGLLDGGVTEELEPIPWGIRPLGSLANLQDLRANQRRARDIADRIAQRQRKDEKAPIHLVGYSGGGGLALLVTEALPEDVKLARLVLIAAAISPQYDLSSAKTHCRGIVNFYSRQDSFVLGWGTRTFGTIDRKNSDSAGHVGFQNADGSLMSADDLTQVGWRPEWRRLGHDGGHIGWLARAWSRDVLAPLLGGSRSEVITAGAQ